MTIPITGAGTTGLFSGAPLGGVTSGGGAGSVTDATKATDGAGNSFGDLLANKIEGMNSKQNEASGLMEDMATGKTDDVAQTMMRIQEANLDLKMATQVRNKVIDAYQEVLRMQM